MEITIGESDCPAQFEALSDEEEDAGTVDHIDWGELLMLAIATSIDALTVGITFASLSVNIWTSVSLIGVTTFVFSIAGVLIGLTGSALALNRVLGGVHFVRDVVIGALAGILAGTLAATLAGDRAGRPEWSGWSA